MKTILFSIIIILASSVSAQVDTIVIHDYTKVMVSLNQKDEIVPVINMEKIQQAGFFINQLPDGYLRVCNTTPLYLWINGRLFKGLQACEFLDPKELFKLSDSDSLYISLYSEEGLSDLVFELVTFQKLQVIKDDPKLPRQTKDAFQEFSITSILIILGLFGFLIFTHPARTTYMARRSFTFKASAYEFINTNFLSSASITALASLSFMLGFFGIYFDQLLHLGFIDEGKSFIDLSYLWLLSAISTFFIFILKWILVSLISKLFQFREINNFQLFDCINFLLVIGVAVFLFIALDFVMNVQAHSWIGKGFVLVFPSILILFITWFSLKFVNNSPRKKLLIISYLCATEIIPAIVIFGWFFK